MSTPRTSPTRDQKRGEKQRDVKQHIQSLQYMLTRFIYWGNWVRMETHKSPPAGVQLALPTPVPVFNVFHVFHDGLAHMTRWEKVYL